MSEAQHKAQGIVAISLMVQVSTQSRRVIHAIIFYFIRFITPTRARAFFIARKLMTLQLYNAEWSACAEVY